MARERTQSDGEIVKRVQEGDQDAFAVLVERHSERVFNVVCHLAGRQDASDLTQDVFLKAFKSIRSFRNASAFSTWLYRITLNTVTSHRRRAANAPLCCIDGGGEEPEEGRGGFEPVAPGPLPQDALVRREEIQTVRRAIDELDPIDKEIIVLRDIEGISYAEITEVLSIPMGTVKSRIYRARLSLREKLATWLESSEDETGR